MPMSRSDRGTDNARSSEDSGNNNISPHGALRAYTFASHELQVRMHTVNLRGAHRHAAPRLRP